MGKTTSIHRILMDKVEERVDKVVNKHMNMQDFRTDVFYNIGINFVPDHFVDMIDDIIKVCKDTMNEMR